MSHTNRHRKGQPQRRRRVSVRAVRRVNPDTERLSRALMSYALQQAADEAAAEAARKRQQGQAE